MLAVAGDTSERLRIIVLPEGAIIAADKNALQAPNPMTFMAVQYDGQVVSVFPIDLEERASEVLQYAVGSGG